MSIEAMSVLVVSAGLISAIGVIAMRVIKDESRFRGKVKNKAS